ncbi:MAG: hypothetical protein ACJ74W_01945 [Pyrinomonadaceae bacterium]
MPWNAIAYVSSGITLVAFIVAVAAWVYRTKALRQERTIRLAPKSKRAALVESALEFFNIDTNTLTREQKYDLALKQIHERAKRFRITASIVVVVVCFAAGVSIFAILRVPTVNESRGISSPTPTTTPSSQTILPTSSPLTIEYRVHVNDERMQPIQGAWVTVKDNDRFTNNFTDSHGIFFTKLNPSTDIVNISVEAEGYIPYNVSNVSIPESKIQEVPLKSISPTNIRQGSDNTKLNEEVRTAIQDQSLSDKNHADAQKIRRKLRDLNIALKSTDEQKHIEARKAIAEAMSQIGMMVARNYEPTDEELFEELIARVKELSKQQDNIPDILKALKI